MRESRTELQGNPTSTIERLAAVVARDPGAAEFPALAEAQRREGRPDEAERVAREGLLRSPERTEALAVLCLALLDQGRNEEVRRALSPVADAVLASGVSDLDFAGEISDPEFENAFDHAEADTEQVMDADRLAREAMQEADLDLPEGFNTSTMANLLERQGDEAGAERIRNALVSRDEALEAGEGLFPLDGPEHQQAAIQTLERWLSNLRRH